MPARAQHTFEPHLYPLSRYTCTLMSESKFFRLCLSQATQGWDARHAVSTTYHGRANNHRADAECGSLTGPCTMYQVQGLGREVFGSWKTLSVEYLRYFFSVCPVCGVSSRALANSGQGATVNHLQLPSPLSPTVSQPHLQRPPILSLFIFLSPSTTLHTYILYLTCLHTHTFFSPPLPVPPGLS